MADYYTTGQITLTNGSASIVGVGTAWVIANVAGGTIFAEAAGNPLPLASIEDDTHATAAIKWTGATGTYDYALLRATAFSEQLEANSNIMGRLLVGLEAGTLYRYDGAGETADRAFFDERPKGFAYLAVDVNPAELYIKASDASGDWAGPFSYGQGQEGDPGPPGPAANVVFEDPETGAPGTEVQQDITGSGTVGDPYHVTFTIPRGDPGEDGTDGTGTGDFVGPAVAVDGNVVAFDGVTGKAGKDSGKKASDLVTGPGVSVASRVAVYADASGKVLSDSGVLLGDAAAKNTGTAAGTLAAGDDSRFSNNGKLNVEDQVLTGGARVTSKSLGTLTTGTLTLDPGDRPLQHYTNNGAHTLAPGSNTGSLLLDITNGASAGAITLTGWTKVAGDAFTTTSGNKFRCHASIGNGGSVLIVQAMQ